MEQYIIRVFDRATTVRSYRNIACCLDINAAIQAANSLQTLAEEGDSTYHLKYGVSDDTNTLHEALPRYYKIHPEQANREEA